MKRTQIQIPDTLHQQALAVAEAREISMAELVRRGLEYMIAVYPLPESQTNWELPDAFNLGSSDVFQQDDWRAALHMKDLQAAEPSTSYGERDRT
ncbi:MAG: antitoxin [Kiritimatiellia bacterium]